MNIHPTGVGVRIEFLSEGVTVPFALIPELIEGLRRAVTGGAISAFLDERAKLTAPD